MSKFNDYTKNLTEKFNKASKVQQIGIAAAAGIGAVVFHPALIAGAAVTGLVTAAAAAAGVAVGGTEAISFWNKKNNGPKQ
ncbi:MAG: hypothetical protein KGL10_03980 [Alphaproteobacteria bacterium]|nr:hypothetical protein [Alphaproteobacteria bacterium]MDE2336448.1 hypothetical protein [Alphaproteobacteria bacterium]